jgi:hypothetical protein
MLKMQSFQCWIRATRINGPPDHAAQATFGSGLTVRMSSVPQLRQAWVTSSNALSDVSDDVGSIEVTTIRWPQ